MFDRRRKAQVRTTETAPGWDAIEARVRDCAVSGGESQHWGSGTLPGQDGLYGLSAYDQGDAWLYVTFGLSELFDKVSDDPAVSGWGIELTMRVPKRTDVAPQWPVQLLFQLGQYVFTNSARFGEGHRFGGISSAAGEGSLFGVAFTRDPELDVIDSPHGQVEFLTAVGATRAELEQMRASTTDAVLQVRRSTSPRLVTHLEPS